MLSSQLTWQTLLDNGFELKSSGTTGDAKPIFQTPEKLIAANNIAIKSQDITADSRILTVCSMDHAGGLLAQTLPAYSIGAHVEIKPFNAYRFWNDIIGFTHTHLTPEHCNLLINTKTFNDVRLDGLFITCGSSEVPFDTIEAFVERGAIFMCNWGMTEIGPITINTVFDSVEKIHHYRETAISCGTLMGDVFYCEYKIDDKKLSVRGDCCVYDDWFDTNDLVQINRDGAMYYMGRHANS
jgi:acyl-CoA synthetase (AMP-forming)/AMP-acid ligase II